MVALLDALTGDPDIAALFGPEAEIAAILRFEAALAEAQGALGILAQEEARRIAEACRLIQPDETALRQGLARDGVLVPDLVRQLRAEAGEKVHLGATSQDAIDSGLMLRLRDVLAIFEARLGELVGILARLSHEAGPRRLMAQTRMQAALPFTVAGKLATWTRPLEEHRERLLRLGHGLPVQLGGPVGTGESFGKAYAELRAQTALRLGLGDRAPWHSDRTPILDIAQGLALLSGTLGKIGQDLALMAQTETGAVKLAGGGGSSAMAHKQNPVGAEVLVALARFNAGMLGTLAQSMVHENERSGAAWTLEWMVLPRMAEACGAALLHALALASGMSFPER